MWKRNRIGNLHAVSAAASPHRARKISKPVGGKQRRALEWRDKKGAGQVRLMVLDSVKFRRNRFRVTIERCCQRLWHSCELRKDLGTPARKRRHAQRITQ